METTGNARDTAASDAYNSLQLQLEELKTSTKAQVDKLSSQKASIDSRNSQLQKQLTAVTRALDESRRCTSDVKEKLEERIREQAVGGDERVKALNAAMALKDVCPQSYLAYNDYRKQFLSKEKA